MRTDLPGKPGRDRFFEEEPDVRALPGARTFESGRHTLQTTRFDESLSVFLPAGFVKIGCEEEAGLVLEHRIKTDNELAAKFIVTGKVLSDHIIGDREEALIRAQGTLDPRLFADASYPFVPADGGITGLACLSTLKPAWVDILSPAKQ